MITLIPDESRALNKVYKYVELKYLQTYFN